MRNPAKKTKRKPISQVSSNTAVTADIENLQLDLPGIDLTGPELSGIRLEPFEIDLTEYEIDLGEFKINLDEYEIDLGELIRSFGSPKNRQ